MRSQWRWSYWALGVMALFLTTVPPVAGQTEPSKAPAARSGIDVGFGDIPYVLTQHNDISRTGANLLETFLTPANVKPALNGAVGFGKIFSRKVDGQIYAQPLYVPAIYMGGKRRNVVFVATMHSSVYAFDADDPNATAPLWKTSFLDAAKGILTCPAGEVGAYNNIDPEVGIVSTPVIDMATLTLYCTSKTKDVAADGSVTYPTRLHALNIQTGAERLPGVKIEGVVAGDGDGDGDPEAGDVKGDGLLVFNPKRHMNRPGLLLYHGVVYMAFGAHSDITPYHGWVFAYDARTLNKIDVWCSTPNGKTDPSGYPLGGGGIWQSGMGIACDGQGNLYLEVGNGTFSADQKGGRDYGDTFVKLRLVNNKITVQDYFTPYNQDHLNRVDADLGVTGPMLVPGTNQIVGGGKEGQLYVADRSKMGGFNPKDDTQITQSFKAYPYHLHGTPAYWDGPAGPSIYIWGESDLLKMYRYSRDAKLFYTTPFATSEMKVPDGMPGASLSVSANGSRNGIIWATHPYDSDANGDVVDGIFRAFDALTLKELWNSKMVAERDDTGKYGKFCAPTVVGGRVYVATFSNELAVYGVAKWVNTPAILPASGEYKTANAPLTVSILCTTPGAVIRYTTDATEPTPSSPAYTVPFKISVSTVVKAKAFAASYMDSGTAVAKYLIDDGPGRGAGLAGSYFNAPDLSGAAVTRIDPLINFRAIGGQKPIAGVGPDNWSARWEGKVLPRATGAYTFTTGSDDGVRLWVNNQLLVDNWTYHGYTENSGTITLQQGVQYAIRLEFFQGGGGADCALYWASDFFNRQIIPQSQLFPR